jgi:ABC-type branched-subunit amino acid transport system ATPase component
VNNLSFAIGQGEILGLIGPNGAGKSTTFNLISGGLRLTSGDVRFGGESVRDARPYEIAARGIGRTFQHVKLMPQMSVLDNVALGAHTFDAAGSLPLGKQRIVEIARALCADPTLLLLDEPAAGLRYLEKQELAALLRSLRAGGMTILLVEHDMEFVMGLTDRLVVMEFGEKLAEGVPTEIQRNPAVREAYLGVA